MTDAPTAHAQFRPRTLVTCLALAWGSLAAALPAAAFTIETDVPDLTVRFDNQVRYNLGVRTDKIDPRIGNNPGFDEGDYKFGRGDVVTNRLDLLSELEVEYRKAFGLRVSAAGWVDGAYSDTAVKQNPGLSGLASSYFNNRYSDLTKRFYRGPSGEILDAFVYANVDVDGKPLSVKIGQHSVYWGNAIFSSAGISYSQQPTDGRKQAATPGVETRETFLPLNQISATFQVSDALQFAGQYFLDWDHVRSPEGGTYLGGSDAILDGPDRAGGGAPFIRAAALGPGSKRGNWGLAARIAPLAWNGTTLGVYYREFDEKNGLWLFRDPANPLQYRAVYPQNTKLLGLSVDATVGPVAVGGEFALRKNAGLNSFAFSAANEGARGDVYHASVNAIYGLTKNAFWDFGTLAAELTYDRLDKVTRNAGLFNGVNSINPATGASSCPLGVAAGCATKDAWGIGVRVAPSWSQVRPGVDLTLPIVVVAGLKGNTADFGGTNEGQVAFSIGAEFDIRKKWQVALTYADIRAKIVPTGASNALGPTHTGNGSGWPISDRGRITLTAKTSF